MEVAETCHVIFEGKGMEGNPRGFAARPPSCLPVSPLALLHCAALLCMNRKVAPLLNFLKPDDGALICRDGVSFGAECFIFVSSACHSDEQLGLGDTNPRGLEPGDMGSGLGLVDLGENRTATRISCGQHNTCAILENGDLKCWGNNEFGM